jgi:PD-(D/E)XK endonuclease
VEKCSIRRNGVVVFNTCSSYAHHASPKMRYRGYAGEIDESAVFCPDLGSVYRVPIDDITTVSPGTLRVELTRNHQSRRVRLAAAYEIARFDVL